MNLAALDDFVTVIRHGGFSKAARATSRPKPTLSRRVRDLEEELGVRLLAEIPLDQRVQELAEAGTPVVLASPNTPAGKALASLALRLDE